VDVPDQYFRDTTGADSILNLKWWEIFPDRNLHALIDSALANNRDVRIAASRIEEARAIVGYTRADQYPAFGYDASGARTNIDLSGQTNDPVNQFSVLSNVNWEIDFWGKYRRATEAARAELLATEFAYRSVLISLISEVASTYFLLLDNRSKLEISRNTLESRQEALGIMQARFDKGIIPELELNQAEIQEASAASAVPLYHRLVATTEHALSVLIGENPRAIAQVSRLVDVAPPDSIPAGIPSELLLRRPDIQEAEQIFAAQTARIGVAQAMRFPSISLTGVFGLASADLSSLVSSNSIAWSVGGGLVGPIFNFGKNKRRVEIERKRAEQALLAYENTVLLAFRDVENGLVEIQTYREELIARIRQRSAAMNALLLSQERYQGGVTSYLEVLDSERTRFESELLASEAYRNHLNAYVSLYKALGGGWVSAEEEQAHASDQE
jgi:multidrug efflux system outer membrane protein